MKCYANYIVHRSRCQKHRNRISSQNYLHLTLSLNPIYYVRSISNDENLSFNLFVSLVGETAGKAPAGVIKREDINVNMDQLRGKANTTNSVVHDTRMVSIHFPH